MRDIKFRGKTYEGKWMYGYYYYGHRNDEHIIVTNFQELDDFIEVIPETVGQYTGLMDKNGDKIYEGDIIYYKNTMHDSQLDGAYSKVEYRLGEYVLRFSNNKRLSMTRFEQRILVDGASELTVKGNIHDNPGLLKKTD